RPVRRPHGRAGTDVRRKKGGEDQSRAKRSPTHKEIARLADPSADPRAQAHERNGIEEKKEDERSHRKKGRAAVYVFRKKRPGLMSNPTRTVSRAARVRVG